MSSNTVTDKIKAVAGSADSGFTNNLANVIEKYNELAIKYKAERSKNKDLTNQVNTLTSEGEKLRAEIASYHSLMNFAVDNVDLESEDESDPVSEQPKPVVVQSKTPQLVDLESESEESEEESQEEDSQEEEVKPPVKTVAKPAAKAPVKQVKK
jgi:hypothetical protein